MRLSAVRRGDEVDWLRPDGKSQVSIEYDGSVPRRVEAIVVSCQHADTVSIRELREEVREKVIHRVLPAAMLDDETVIYINPTVKVVVSGLGTESEISAAGSCVAHSRARIGIVRRIQSLILTSTSDD